MKIFAGKRSVDGRKRRSSVEDASSVLQFLAVYYVGSGSFAILSRWFESGASGGATEQLVVGRSGSVEELETLGGHRRASGGLQNKYKGAGHQVRRHHIVFTMSGTSSSCEGIKKRGVPFNAARRGKKSHEAGDAGGSSRGSFQNYRKNDSSPVVFSILRGLIGWGFFYCKRYRQRACSGNVCRTQRRSLLRVVEHFQNVPEGFPRHENPPATHREIFPTPPPAPVPDRAGCLQHEHTRAPPCLQLPERRSCAAGTPRLRLAALCLKRWTFSQHRPKTFSYSAADDLQIDRSFCQFVKKSGPRAFFQSRPAVVAVPLSFRENRVP